MPGTGAIRDDELEDAELVRRAQSELPYRVGAFEALMRRHGSRIVGLCRRFARNPADAQDLAQEVMVRVFFELPRFRGESAVTTWLWRIAANLAVDHQRRIDARPAEVADAERACGDYPDPRSSLSAIEAKIDAERLLQALSGEDRLIVLLRLSLELEFGEIAGVLGMGLSAVKMRYARALDKLRALVAQPGKRGEGGVVA
ncbi:MAG: RNA polymerase subunit sigma [Chloracidobacterium sp. CP2_5A]|nr:MAG: RNA polymerase subunit sigma [Chloracidobacterium sp. CP2_5A]